MNTESNEKDRSGLKGYYKVPFRQVYCETIRGWIAETIYCHVVLKIDPPTFAKIG